jgi:hypothetical protein
MKGSEMPTMLQRFHDQQAEKKKLKLITNNPSQAKHKIVRLCTGWKEQRKTILVSNTTVVLMNVDRLYLGRTPNS